MHARILGKLLLAISCLPGAAVVHATTEWNAQEYNLYTGDFDGDGKTDLLYIAKDVARASGIVRSDGTAPTIPHQIWPSNYLGIPWSGDVSQVVVADFNGDGRADIFLQRNTPGDHYLLLTDAQGKVAGISQTLGNTHLSSVWSADTHVLTAGDFNGDGRSDLFLQAVKRTDNNAVFLVNSSGLFTASATQTWNDGYLGFKWSTRDARVYAGNFNGVDGAGLSRADLLIQARPKVVLIDYDVAIPVPSHPPNMNGVVFAGDAPTVFQAAGVQAWSRYANGVDWSPLTSNVVIGDFNGDGRADVLLQARNPPQTSYLLTGNAAGSAFAAGSALASNVAWSANGYRLIAGNFDGAAGAGVYMQATAASGTNYIANTVTGSSVATVENNPAAVTGVLPTTVVGHTVGSFGVSNSGSATYSIGIAVPPGVAGIQPQVSINYDSGAGNGLLGLGWFLGGFSEIERCGKTLVQDGSTDGVSLTTQDRFCIDGGKLRLTGGTYGVANSTYQTEMETFALITAHGTAGNGPAYFVVETREGLRMEYGNSVDSRIEAINTTASTTPHTWALNKVSDPHGNTMTLSYEKDGAPNGSFRPLEMLYTANANAGLTAAYKLRFEWATRPPRDTLFQYIAGSSTKETKRLDRIETRYYDQGSWRLVRKYQLSYNASGATPRSRLSSIQECDGAGGCLAPTSLSWYDGVAGWEDSTIGSATNAAAVLEAAYPIDIDGDSRTDLVYPQTSGSTAYWYWMRAGSNGQYLAPASTSFVPAAMAQPYSALSIDYSATGRQGLLTSISGNAELQILEWNAASGTLGKTPTNITATLQGREWVGDFTGDGRDDYMYSATTGNTATFYLRANSGMSGGVAQFAAATAVTTLSVPGGVASGPDAAWSRDADFNGDGRSDLLVRTQFTDCEMGSCIANVAWTVLLSSGSGFNSTAWVYCEAGNCGQAQPAVGDFNGDGFADFVVLSSITINTTAYVIRYGHSLGITTGPQLGSAGLLGLVNMVADYDGDGRTDFLYPSGSTWSVRRATESGFEAAVATSIPAASPNATHRAVDIDGDGQVDIGYKDTTWKVRRHRGGVSDIVKSVADGYGNTVTVNYAPLTDSQVYTKGSGATYPIVDITAPMYVVKDYSMTDGIGGSYTVSEKYTQARAHVQGVGYLGFGSRSTTDGRNGIKSVTNFRQDYPYVGFVDKAYVYQANGTTLISETSNTPSTLDTSTTLHQERRYPYIYQSVQKSYEVGGAGNGLQIAEVTTTSTIDSYGNATAVTATTVDKTGTNLTYTSTISNTYDTGDANCWRRGFITRQQVTKTVPIHGSETRTVDFVKDTANPAACRLYQEIVEPLDVTGTMKVTTTIGYDVFGHPSSQSVGAMDVPTRTTSTSYGPQGVYPVSVTNSLNQSATKTYDYALGVPRTATDPNGIGVSWEYDGFGRMMVETRPDSTKTSYAYSPCNIGNSYCGDTRLRYQVEKRELDTAGAIIRVTKQSLDSFGRPIYNQSQTLSGAMATMATNYDNFGRPYQQSQPYFTGFPAYFSTTTYDLVGRPAQDVRRISEADSGTQSTLYSYNRRIHTLTDANGKVTTQEMNVAGQVIKMTDAASGVTQYEYDPFGNLKKTIDPLNNQIVNVYNKRGFKTQTSDPDMGVWNYTYYATGELRTQTDAKAQTVTLQYDALSRPLARVEAEGTSTFTYGTSAASYNIGRLQSMSSPGSYSESYSYDNKGRLENATVNAGGAANYVITNAYNSSTGLLESVTYPQSTTAVPGSRFKVKYEYEYGLPKRVRDFNTPATIYWEQLATNAAGQSLDEQYGNGFHSYSTYDAITGLLGARTAGSTAQVQNLTYQWDKTGNVVQRRDLNLNLAEDFYYDDLYRLKCSTLNVARQASCSALTAPQKNLDMAYDVLGNITSKSGIGGYAYPTSGSTSVRPHAVTAAGSTNYVYDNNGNMMSRGGSNITWYSYNLPKKIDNGGNSAEFFYGATRSRFKQVAITAAGGSLPAGTQTTLYIAGLYEQVTKPSGVIEHKHYIVAGGEAVAIRTLRSNSADDTRYMHKDHLGSVDVITSETGSVVQRLSYDAFGQRRNATAWSGALLTSDWTSIAAITPRGFTFHEELDNVDLIHMNGRVYDANIGRFISADPFIQAPLMSQSFNRYSYVVNNPLSLVDPSGYSWLSKAFKKIARHVNAVARFHLIPTPRNFFETIKSIPGQDKIDRYVMTHEWAYKVGYAAAVVSSWWIGGYGGAVYQSYYTYIATGSATEAVKVGVRAAAIQFATNYVLTGSGFSMSASTSSRPIILYADGGAGAAGGADLFDVFMRTYDDAPSAPEYSTVGGTQILDTITAPWGGWDDFKDAVRCTWECDMPGNGSLDANLAGLPPIIGGVTRAPNLLRPLQASDFGVKSLKALEGSLRVDGSLATVAIRNIEGNLGHYMDALSKLKDTARATGATSLRLEGTVANPTLQRALERVLGPAQRGMPGGAQDYWLITL